MNSDRGRSLPVFSAMVGLVFGAVVLGVALDHAAAEPKGKLTIAMNVDPPTLDPHMVADQPSQAILVNIFDGLVARHPETMQPVPQLAESWRRVNDTTWEFKLRKGVKFHNGEDFNADAVKFSLDRSLNPAQKAPLRGMMPAVKEIRTIDAYTVHIVTDGPSPTVPNRLTVSLGAIVPPKYTKEQGDAFVARNPVGTGPFKFVEWLKDDRLVLEANPNYWAGPPRLRTVVFKPIPEAAARIAALQTGTADLITNIPPDQTGVLKRDQRFEIKAVPSMLVVFFGMEAISSGPLQDRRVRQAINYAVDREAIVKNVMNGYGKAIGSPVPPETFAYEVLKPYPYDPPKAKQLLKDAGYANGFKLNVNAPSGRYSMDKDVAESVAGYLQKIGIQANARIHEWGSYVKLRYGILDPGSIYMLGWGGSGTGLAELTLFPLYRSGQPISTTKDEVLDKLLDEAQRSLDDKRRAAVIKEAQKRVVDGAHRLFLFQQYYIYGMNKRVENWAPRTDEYLILQQTAVKDS